MTHYILTRFVRNNIAEVTIHKGRQAAADHIADRFAHLALGEDYASMIQACREEYGVRDSADIFNSFWDDVQATAGAPEYFTVGLYFPPERKAKNVCGRVYTDKSCYREDGSHVLDDYSDAMRKDLYDLAG